MKTLLCYGDSNTFGHDPRSGIGSRFPDDVRWTGLLASAGWQTVNCGLNGRQIPIAPAEMRAAADQILASAPSLTAVMLGSNDLLWNAGFPAEDVALRMDGFLRYLCGVLPAAADGLLLIAPPAMQRGHWVETDELVQQSRLLGGYYADLAAKLGVHFADASQWNVELGFDGLHFTEAGHAAFAAGLCSVLETL